MLEDAFLYNWIPFFIYLFIAQLPYIPHPMIVVWFYGPRISVHAFSTRW